MRMRVRECVCERVRVGGVRSRLTFVSGTASKYQNNDDPNSPGLICMHLVSKVRLSNYELRCSVGSGTGMGNIKSGTDTVVVVCVRSNYFLFPISYMKGRLGRTHHRIPPKLPNSPTTANAGIRSKRGTPSPPFKLGALISGLPRCLGR